MKKLVLLSALCFAISIHGWSEVPGTGHVSIGAVRSDPAAKTLPRPARIVVVDFTATARDVELNSSALSRARTRVSGTADDQKAKIAQSVADEFSASLVRYLQKSGLPLTRAAAGEQLPQDALIVRGEFLAIDEGNRARRMAIGLGAGASKVESHVQCLLQTGAGSTTVTEFTATAHSSRKPGAAETMGAGAAPEAAAAVSGATEMKQDAEGDTGRMAKAVAGQIIKAMTADGWLTGGGNK